MDKKIENNLINRSLKEFYKEMNVLTDLKEKGKFNLQQSEYSLKRLTQNIINIWNNEELGE